MTQIKRRAISDSQKRERFQAIIDTALRLFEKQTYQEVTLEVVAAEMRIARATLYLYFKTREELFLVVLEQLYQKWHLSLSEKLKLLLEESTAASKLLNINQVADLITATLIEQWPTTRLAALLPTVLEQNIDFETALRFKRSMLSYAMSTSLLLEECLPFLKGGLGGQFLLRVQIIVTGLQPYAEPAPVIQKVVVEPDMAMLRLDFRQECTTMLRALLYEMKMR